MSKEINHIVKLFEALQHGDCWIGINFKEALLDVDAAKAAVKVNADRNSIWMLTAHLIYWRTSVVNRLSGSLNPPPFADFLLPEQMSEANWKQTLLDFEAAYHSLRSAILHFNADFMHYPSPKPEQTYYDLMMGCLQHDAYHLGQMVLLKKSI